MTEKELKTFIDVVIKYFQEVTAESVKMGIPFVKNDEPIVKDYTGVIGVSGSQKGGIFLTSERKMLEDISGIILGTDDISEEVILDMVGEIANTIAGNVRSTFGSDFMISVPIILQGKPKNILFKLKPPVFIIPIEWRDYKAYLAIGLE